MEEEKQAFFENEEDEGEIIPNDSISLQNKVLRPDAKEIFKHINQDFVISNLTSGDIKFCENICEVVNILHSYEKDDVRFKEINELFLHPVYTRLNLNRSKGGFERTLMTTLTQVRKLVEQRKRGGFFKK